MYGSLHLLLHYSVELKSRSSCNIEFCEISILVDLFFSRSICRNQPLRVYSMVKYAAIARGDAEIFMKFARAGYKEKIWDHAAGVLIIQEAGGVVTDAGGRPLDFSKGIYLEGLDRGIIACSGAILHEKIIKAVYDSWDSSNL